MDDMVRQAMAKWPLVPDCYGWLGLDSRGHWYMRDERVQVQGLFQSGVQESKGSLLKHEKLIEFIHRNYEKDATGRWFFQNGPQRVFIELEHTPYIWRIENDHLLVAHTGQSTRALACLVDEKGLVYLDTPLGIGLVHTLDVGLVADAIEQGVWRLEECLAADLPKRYGYVLSPQMAERKERA